MTEAHSKSIVLMTNILAVGGTETQLRYLACELKSRGWQVSILSLLPPLESLVSEMGSVGIPVYSPSLRRNFILGMLRTGKLLRELRPQAICAFLFHANLLARIWGRLLRVPVVLTSIRSVYSESWVRGILHRLLSCLDDGTVVNSQTVLKTLEERGILSPKKSIIIPNMINLQDAALSSDPTSLRRSLSVDEKAWVWLAVGRIDPLKDYPCLIQAFASCVSHFKMQPCVLLIAGDGSAPLLEQLKTQAKNLGLEQSVFFLGNRDDVPALLKMANAYVLSSEIEGTPNALLEAMAAAKPIVATGVGAVPELIQDGVSGRIVPAQNPEFLANAMIETMSSASDFLRRMGTAAQRTVLVHYGPEYVTGLWLELVSQKLLPNIKKE